MKKLLYVCEADSGGIMEYAIRQSAAISREEVEVHFLCKPSFPVERLAEGIKIETLKSGQADTLKNARGVFGKIGRVVKMIADLRCEAKQVDQLAEKLLKDSSTRNSLPVTSHDLGEGEIAVLFACYKEYFAPFWVGPLRKLAKKGVVIGTIAHDPVRDFGERRVEFCSFRTKTRASSGAGPLKTVVEKYHLGVFVEPDDLDEVVRGASKFVPNSATEQPATRYHLPAISSWNRYERENSWEENARKVVEVFEA